MPFADIKSSAEIGQLLWLQLTLSMLSIFKISKHRLWSGGEVIIDL
jgi:hypothetical protein